MTDLIIVDFPRQRKLPKVQFAETAQLHIYIYKRHNVPRRKLWFTMKLAVREDVLKARAGRTSNDTADADADADASDAERSSFWIGIAHLLTPACIDEVRTCRAQCIYAVLTEQARQGLSTRFNSWETIALASFAQTRQPVLRARELAIPEERHKRTTGRLNIGGDGWTEFVWDEGGRSMMRLWRRGRRRAAENEGDCEGRRVLFGTKFMID
eukprot:scaffold4463_cov152-Skeletonema_marinoi.AAC.4